MRAAAELAVQAGFQVWAADCFGDRDLQAVAYRSERLMRYPEGILDWAERLPPMPWMYTGALENSPDLIERVSRRHCLWGNSAATVRLVRAPERWTTVLRTAGMAVPEHRWDPPRRSHAERWLVKPLRSAAGLGVVEYEPDNDPDGHSAPVASRPMKGSSRKGDRVYYQQRIDGWPAGGVYLASGGAALLLGVTRQLSGTAWTGAKGFLYAGSVGPLPLPARLEAQFAIAGQALVQEFGLRGLFGVDAVVSGETVWPLEINPRFTASLEVLAAANPDWRLLAWHAGACRDVRLPRLSDPPDEARCWGKAVVYAARPMRAETILQRWSERPHAENARIADVPAERQQVATGHPACTVLCSGLDQEQVLQGLRLLAEHLRS